MKWRCLLLAGAFTSYLPAAEWIKVSSANFTLYSTHAENDARRVLDTFEQTREFFRQVKAFSVTSQLPFTLVDFGSESEYRPFNVGPFVRAYFTGDDEGDYIVMSDVGKEAKRVAVHEYVHSVVRHSGLRLPLWLNEGLAEVYGNGDTGRDDPVGEIPPDRTDTLRSVRWLKLPDLFRIGPKSPEFNERDTGGMFYAQGCLLAHMLMLSEGYSAKFSTFLEAISASGSEQTAFSQVYGKSLVDIERDLQSYFAAPTKGSAAFKVETRSAAVGPAKAAGDVEIGLTLAEILTLTGRAAEGMARLHMLGTRYADNPDLAVAAAFQEWRSGEVDAAIEHFHSILGRPNPGWKAWWNYSIVLKAQGGNRAAETEALQKVVETKPGLAIARIRLGLLLLEAGKPAEALSQFREIKEVASQNTGTMYLAMAHAALATGQVAEAKQYAESAGKSPLKADQQSLLRQIVAAIESGVPASRDNAELDLAAEADDDPGRPILRRKKPVPPE